MSEKIILFEMEKGVDLPELDWTLYDSGRNIYSAPYVIEPRMKFPLSRASGRSVLVLIQTAGKHLKYDDSSGSVPLSDTTQKAFFWRLL